MNDPDGIELVEVAPGLYRRAKPDVDVARSDLPMPHVISDEMEPCEQVDGKFYTSKAKFRAVGRAHGLIEVGNDPARFKPKVRATEQRSTKVERRRALEQAVAQYKAGRRVRV